jgi:hypothetical protein
MWTVLVAPPAASQKWGTEASAWYSGRNREVVGFAGFAVRIGTWKLRRIGLKSDYMRFLEPFFITA